MSDGKGLLVKSKTSQFVGVGKVIKISGEDAEVGFFESPLRAYANRITVPVGSLVKAHLYEEMVVFVVELDHGIFRRARYGGPRPDNQHLVIFRSGKNAEYEDQICAMDQIFVPWIDPSFWPDVSSYLKARATDGAINFYQGRQSFVREYLRQTKICGGYPVFLSTGVDIQPHQIAVVKTVLDDTVKRYLLADEVGLGKTIEAGLLISEHINRRKRSSNVFISVPDSLIRQWVRELAFRFFLADVISVYPDRTVNTLITIVSHDELCQIEFVNEPTLLVVDESHQIVPTDLKEKYEVFEAHMRVSASTPEAYLLSGTPIGGNEIAYLGMLALLDCRLFSFDVNGLEKFQERLGHQESITGAIAALYPENDDIQIESTVLELRDQFTNDKDLEDLIDDLLPHVEMFSNSNAPSDRFEAIVRLREYLADHYKLFRRMIRNRRDHPGISVLFPGLDPSGVDRLVYKSEVGYLDSEALGLIDQVAFSDRLSEHDKKETVRGISSNLLRSPLSLYEFINSDDFKAGFLLNSSDLERFRQISDVESECRVDVAVKKAKGWLDDYPDGLVIIFCDNRIEGIWLEESLKTTTQSIWNEYRDSMEKIPSSGIVIGGAVIEDGLNLHGKYRLVLHYSLPISILKLEQRMGRVNRFSANLKGVLPVQCAVVMPSQNAFFSHWVNVLDETLGVFRRTVASLQFRLQESFDDMWESVAAQGTNSFFSWPAEKLIGPNGVIESESNRIKVQEEILSLGSEMVEAKQFATQLEKYDYEFAGVGGREMDSWISQLHFARDGDIEGSFRYRYVESAHGAQQTLVDAESFKEKCFTGLDTSLPLGQIGTQLFSIDRLQVLGATDLRPFRIGTRFVDSIWELLRVDARGICQGSIRYSKSLDLQNVRSVSPYFEMQFASDIAFLNGEDPLKCRNGRYASRWLDGEGNIITDQNLIENLLTRDKALYEDGPLDPIVWTRLIEPVLDQNAWVDTVDRVIDKGVSHIQSTWDTEEMPILLASRVLIFVH